MLSRLASRSLCRSIQLLALLAHDAAKELEILGLGHHLAVLHRQTPRPKLRSPTAPCSLPAAASCPIILVQFLVKPETLLGWHRRLVAGA